MVKQCAGCATVFEDGNEPLGETSPRSYGCCPDCNSTSFRTHEQNEVKAPAPVKANGKGKGKAKKQEPVEETA